MEMLLKVDVSKNLNHFQLRKDERRMQFLLAVLLESWYLFEIPYILLTVKISDNGVKSRCFKKTLKWGASSFFHN